MKMRGTKYFSPPNPRSVVSFSALLILIVLCAFAQSPDKTRSYEALPLSRWQEDIRFLADTLFLKHVNAFHTRSQRELEESARAMSERISRLSPTDRVVEFARFLALVGDGHTRMWLYERPKGFHPIQFGRYPIRVYWFEEGLFIVGASPKYSSLLGARVDSIGKISAAEALARVGSLISHDNSQGVLQYSPIYLTTPEVLHALGLCERDYSALWTVTTVDGGKTNVSLEPASANDPVQYLTSGAFSGERIFQEPGPFAMKQIQGSVVVQINQMSDSAGRKLLSFTNEVLAVIDSSKAKRLVIDFRYNSGGNATLIRPFIEELAKRPVLNRRGGLFLLIERATFSAALWNALDLQRKTNIILIGNPTSGKPNGFGETDEFVLPNTGLRFSVATRFNQRSTPDDSRPWLSPDVTVPLSFRDAMKGQDRVLETAVGWK